MKDGWQIDKNAKEVGMYRKARFQSRSLGRCGPCAAVAGHGSAEGIPMRNGWKFGKTPRKSGYVHEGSGFKSRALGGRSGPCAAVAGHSSTSKGLVNERLRVAVASPGHGDGAQVRRRAVALAEDNLQLAGTHSPRVAQAELVDDLGNARGARARAGQRGGGVRVRKVDVAFLVVQVRVELRVEDLFRMEGGSVCVCVGALFRQA